MTPGGGCAPGPQLRVLGSVRWLRGWGARRGGLPQGRALVRWMRRVYNAWGESVEKRKGVTYRTSLEKE
jgi:hypothetical protein